MGNFLIVYFILLVAVIDGLISARILSHTLPQSHRPSISFYMPDIITDAHPSAPPKLNQHLPFSKPLKFLPPNGGILIPMPTLSSNTIDFPGLHVSFPARATLEELEVATVMAIDENTFGSIAYFKTQLIGRVKGMYVVSQENPTGHMMALTASFGNREDELSFFGEYSRDLLDSHIAVIGGTGKYEDANGYATLITVNVSGSSYGMRTETEAVNNFLLFTVYLG
ncbi:dirigent protein 18-like [Apium graveolens]|uniref:dirigent protein 18-like n=1 Tax=Apium graveolens TaxID=4045 RepID=UPI003D7ABF51